jgi:hypothetical protein
MDGVFFTNPNEDEVPAAWLQPVTEQCHDPNSPNVSHLSHPFRAIGDQTEVSTNYVQALPTEKGVVVAAVFQANIVR